jgi:hypothetical protein
MMRFSSSFAKNTSAYNTAGATLSEKSVGEEYCLSAAQLEKGVELGKLTFQHRSAHGNSYRLFVRSEVEFYSRSQEPDPVLKAIHTAKNAKLNLVTKRARFDTVSTELASIDARKAALIQEKEELVAWLLTNDPKAAADAKKVEAAAKKAETAAKKAEKAAITESKKRKVVVDSD